MVQHLHTKGRKRGQGFFCVPGFSLAASSNHHPLEQPWQLSASAYDRRADPRLFANGRDETAALTEQIAAVEKELDARAAALYGLE